MTARITQFYITNIQKNTSVHINTAKTDSWLVPHVCKSVHTCNCVLKNIICF